MTPEKHGLLQDPETVINLSSRLSRLSSVSRFDVEGLHVEASTLAHAFSDLERVFLEFCEVHLPRVVDEASSADQLDRVLHEIGEDFREIIYHIADARYYRHLLESSKPRKD